MKNTNKHLDDLFASARQEEPIISEENARELLAGSEHMQASPFIFSTKGIIMSTIGLSLAAFIGYLALSGSPQTPVTHTTSISVPATNLFAHSTNSNTDEPKKIDAKVTEVNGETSPTPPAPPLPPIPPLPHLPLMISTPLKVTGIRPIVLAPEKYAKMGVSKKEDGTVTFSQKNENGKIFSMSFPKNTWGIIIGDQQQNENSEAPHFAPLIVTDTKGNKRMMQFTHKGNGIEWHNLQVQSYGESDHDVKSDSTYDPDTVMRGESKDIIGDGIKMIRHEVKTLNKESKVVMNVYMPNNIRLDSNIDREKHFAFDTTDKSFGEKMEWIKDEMQIRIRRGDNEDSLANLGASIGEMLRNEVKKESSSLDNLVPILVRTATSEHVNKEEGITYDDGLIFWYNPEKELLAAVPEAQSSVSPSESIASGIISKAVLYPNPAKNKTTLHFDLSEPRTIAFSVHDLLGKRVLDGGSIRETSAGSYDHEFDLSELTPGVYLLVITTDKGEQSMQRLVIQK